MTITLPWSAALRALGAWAAAATMATVVVVALAGCLSPGQRREESLVRQARTFNDDWRWARWEALLGMMPPEEAAAFRSRLDTLEGSELVLADFEVTNVDFAPDTQSAKVTARFEWYLKRDPRLRDTTVEEHWEHRDGRWLVVGLRRTRGDRFGLVPEPTPTPSSSAAPSPAP